ncbi:SWI5/SAE3 family protein [Aspergillus novofumigatus IBT 16806]|uniref:Swi5-domain-containing protein n=1 Tax=Aspergillus novofumigatus (strain IBT 16806) TaxID=1392255 RepID=A0A2I1CGP5_ASPN1|nr:Swi5-domain-containing protein [Aspergillus novofumigatus IBT 16806]PKX96802.1 Swi5-domain-containing protein [Aspergillus novofumigatus IBT 16806]
MASPGKNSPLQQTTENSDILDLTHPTSEQQIQRDKKIASIADLHSQTAQLEAQIAETKAKLKHDPSTTVKRHIRLLHEYNEIKDIGQGLMGLIADARGMRQVDVQREFGVGDRD